MTKVRDEKFKNSTKYWFCYNDYVDNYVKVRDHSHITGKHRSSAHRDCNTNLKLNRKIPVSKNSLMIQIKPEVNQRYCN